MPDLAETLRNLSEHQELLEYLSELHQRGITDARILATLRAQFPPTERNRDREVIHQLLGIEREAIRASQQVPHEAAERMGEEAWRRAMEREFEPPSNRVFPVTRNWIGELLPTQQKSCPPADALDQILADDD